MSLCINLIIIHRNIYTFIRFSEKPRGTIVGMTFYNSLLMTVSFIECLLGLENLLLLSRLFEEWLRTSGSLHYHSNRPAFSLAIHNLTFVFGHQCQYREIQIRQHTSNDSLGGCIIVNFFSKLPRHVQLDLRNTQSDTAATPPPLPIFVSAPPRESQADLYSWIRADILHITMICRLLPLLYLLDLGGLDIALHLLFCTTWLSQ